MYSLEKIINFEKLTQLQNLNFSGLEKLPCHFYVKDRMGKYLNCNDATAQTAGLSKSNDLVGSHDLELCWAKYASPAIKNDLEVMTTGKPKCESESFHDHNNNIFVATGLKFPLRGRSNKIIGVIGLSIIQKNDFSNASAKFNLTKREHECLYYLSKGKTAQQMADIFFISKRTVEKHIDNIKSKLNCKNKSELIDKLMEDKLINSIFPLFLS